MNSEPLMITHRNLPHWKTADAVYWITFHLADSLPQKKLKAWRAECDVWKRRHPPPWNEALRREYQRRFGDRLEGWLDAGHGKCVFKEPGMRQLLLDCLLKFHLRRHRIHLGVIMPNHVHMLMEPYPGEDLSALMKGVKGTSARRCNQYLGSTGKFWMEESYDHIVRSMDEYDHYLEYIRDNPRKAHLRHSEYSFFP